jgi:perosamine synthetase
MGRINCFSFYANKIITTGEGGMVVTNDTQLYERCKLLKDLSHAKGRRFWHEELGWNFRMTNLQAALGLGQLHHIQDFLKTKQWMAEAYGKGLAGIPGLQLPITKDYAKNVYWMYGVVLDESFPLSRDELRAKLKEKGIDTRDFFLSAASMPVSQAYPSAKERYPVAERLSKQGFYLPSGLALTQEQVDYVCETLKTIVRN